MIVYLRTAVKEGKKRVTIVQTTLGPRLGQGKERTGPRA